ncbi:MAG TPA: hypothetical protein VJX67_08085 [Blastocatellia bacterium]|nr:hypothetical protein [Blastocatellia bacterium]
MVFRKTTLATTALLIVASAALAYGQGPIEKVVRYEVNVPYTLRMANYTLPAGRYILHQVLADDLNLFALYKDDMMHSPIAMIRTARIDYASRTSYPDKTKMLLTVDESDPDATPIIRGWNVPGDDGWEVIAVVPSHNGIVTRGN